VATPLGPGAPSLSTVGTTESAGGERAEGFWAGYWKSLKPLDVEEPIDVWVHRPLAYVLARVALPTPISPNLITVISIVFGVLAGVCMLSSFAYHLPIAGVLLFWSAIFDCADGQLARMRGTSSAFGRMLDGVADFVVALSAVGGSIYVVWSKYHQPSSVGFVAIALCVLTAVTGSFHTGMYDHFKNVYLKLTSERFREGESYAQALERFEAKQNRDTFFSRVAWPIYLFYTREQEKYVRRFDPYTTARLELLPEYDSERAELYKSHSAGLMKIWRGWFGFGSLVFGISLAAVLDVIEWYMLARLIGMNAVFFGYLRPNQRRASRDAFRKMGILLPDQRA
jgi:phosphatidylglycerophosphate synthase